MVKKPIKFNSIATAIMAFVLLLMHQVGLHGFAFFVMALVFGLLTYLLWFAPVPVDRRNKNLAPGFEVAFEHDYVALDTANRRLWICDPKRGQRYLEPEDIITIRTGMEEAIKGRVHQHLEFQINDLEHPVWYVWFDRHPESRIKGSNRNTQERDEWFARIKTWAGMKNLR